MSTPVREGQKVSYAPRSIPLNLDEQVAEDEQRKWAEHMREKDRQRDADKRLTMLSAALQKKEHKLGTLDEIRLLLKSIEYGDMMKLAKDLSVLRAEQENGDSDMHNMAAALHAYAVKDQAPGLLPEPRESLSKAAEEYRADDAAKSVPPLAASQPAYHDQPADVPGATSPIPREGAYARGSRAVRNNDGDKG